VVIGAKAIYVATGFSVYAINSKDGTVLWNYRTQFKTLSLGVYKDFVYVGSQAGKAGSLIILNGE
jgi:outer membrane protein assembly factor BamB